MTTEEKFRAAVNVIKNLPKNGSYQPSHDLMSRFYAYFKQATEGPCKAPRPAFWEVVKKMKWDAWSRLGNMPREEAMDNYVEELKKIVETMSYTDNVASFSGSSGSFYDHVPAEDSESSVGPVIERSRSQPGSPSGGSPFGSREASPTRGPANGGPAPAGGARMSSSSETSPASSYSASPSPPDADDDDEDEEFKDTLEAAPERFVKDAPSDAGSTAPAPKKAFNGLSNGYANGFANGLSTVTPQAQARVFTAPAPERGRPPLRTPPVQHRTSPSTAENDAAAVDISESISAVVARLQQDLQQVTSRSGSSERAMLARDASSRNQKAGGGGGAGAGGAAGAGAVVRRGPRWWPIRDSDPRTVLSLAAWPVVVHSVSAWVQRRRRPHFSV